jgi:hypothetical protein
MPCYVRDFALGVAAVATAAASLALISCLLSRIEEACERIFQRVFSSDLISMVGVILGATVFVSAIVITAYIIGSEIAKCFGWTTC